MKIRTFGRVISLGLGLTSLAACGGTETTDTNTGAEGGETPVAESGRTDACPTGKCDSPNASETFEHKWAVDMKKVNEHYGRTTKYFFGMTPQESGIDPNLIIPGLTQAIAAQMVAAGMPEDAAAQAAAQQATAMANQPIWDQMASRNSDHSLHVDADGENGVDKNVQVILEDGTQIDPPGYVNIIPMYRDTDPTKQNQIRKYMKNGDVIVYFHPEFTETKDHMERRASHIAMHYDITDPVTGQEMVHHIDNPNGYGPMYNHRPTKHMPFHIYRFQPRADKVFGVAPAGQNIAAEIEGVGFTRGQEDAVLGLVNPEVNLDDTKERLKFQIKLDVELSLDYRAAENIITYLRNTGRIDSLKTLGGIPYVDGEALTLLRDGVDAEEENGFTIDATMADMYSQHAADWAFITNDLSPFADFFTLTLQNKTQIDDFAVPAINGEDMPRLYCSGLAYANLNLALNRPLNSIGLGEELWETFKSSNYYLSDINKEFAAEWVADQNNLPGIDRMVFESYAATDIVNNWINTNLGHLPVPIRQALLATPELQQQMVRGFSQLEWSDSHAEEKSQTRQFDPASEANVARWAKAYGLGADATQAYLESDEELFNAFRGLDIPLAGLTPMDVLQAVERATVSNRFVPPRIWMDVADRADSNMVYVGTVLNCELLSAADGSDIDACAGGGGGVEEFAEGAADTSTYAHYAITNGGQRTHRRFDGTPGPKNMGYNTTFTVGFTAADVEDIVFMVHTPEMWADNDTVGMSMYEYDTYCTEKNPEGSCAPNTGIFLDPMALLEFGAGAIEDQRLTFELFGDNGVCQPAGEDIMDCPTVTVKEDGSLEYGDTILTRNAHGLFAVTMLDVKARDEGVEFELCTECANGGAHFDGWRLKIRND
ncbi:MAG: hypothetical protein ACE366_31095 [Bradymonadia bacterium]